MERRFLPVAVGLFLTLLFSSILNAQEVQVPDVSGLTAAQAAAQLNDLGLALGTQTGEVWDESLGIPTNTVGEQSVAPGSAVAAGTAIDVSVYSSPNAFFIYDENDITFVNDTGTVVNMRELLFASGDQSKVVEATEWGIAFAEPADCFQLWSIAARSPKEWEQCTTPIYWRSTRNTDLHFWTQLAGVTDFVLLQNGIERARCASAVEGSEPIRCDFFVATAQSSDLTPFLYMAYTTDSFIVFNNTDDRWMPTDGTPLYIDPDDPELAYDVSDPSQYSNPNPVARLEQLAPGQCIHIVLEGTTPETPEPCTVIAQRSFAPVGAFWQRGFEIDNDLVDERVDCPPATEGRTTLCIMPR